MTFISEAAVIEKIENRLKDSGSKARVSVHSDSQSSASVERTVVFKASVALENSEVIVNGMADIGADTDRAISYKGSQVEPANDD